MLPADPRDQPLSVAAWLVDHDWPHEHVTPSRTCVITDVLQAVRDDVSTLLCLPVVPTPGRIP